MSSKYRWHGENSKMQAGRASTPTMFGIMACACATVPMVARVVTTGLPILAAITPHDKDTPRRPDGRSDRPIRPTSCTNQDRPRHCGVGGGNVGEQGWRVRQHVRLYR